MTPRPKILVTPYKLLLPGMPTLEPLQDAGLEPVMNTNGRYWTDGELAALSRDCDYIIATAGKYDESTLSGAQNLKFIIKFGVGTDNIDLDYCRQRGIGVAATFGSNHHSVADFAFAMLMSAASRIPDLNNGVRAGIWEGGIHSGVHGQRLAIVGLGRIGIEVAKRARGFSMDIGYWDQFRKEDEEAELGAQYMEIDDLLSWADFVSLHLPKNEETAGLLDARRLDLIRPSCFLINTARGGLVDEEHLHALLVQRRIAGAAFDVFEREPPTESNLLALPNFIATPHCAAATYSAYVLSTRICIDCIVRHHHGQNIQPQYAVLQSTGGSSA
jgi:phosphoglycerate dehydrogenase-like enzyme